MSLSKIKLGQKNNNNNTSLWRFTTCERHRVSAATGHPDHRLLDALHQLRDSVSGQLVGAQTQFTAVTLTERVQTSVNWDTEENTLSHNQQKYKRVDGFQM